MTRLDRIKQRYPYLIIQEVEQNYITFYNTQCKHTSKVRIDHILYHGTICNNKECKSRHCSDAQHSRFINTSERHRISKLTKQALNTPEKRLKISQGVINAYKDTNKKLNILNGQAENQRKKKSPFELTILDILDKYKINYAYQYPLIIDDLPFDVIFDVYLLDYDTYININLDSCHKKYPYVANKDKILKEHFKDKLLVIENIKDLLDFLSLKGVVLK